VSRYGLVAYDSSLDQIGPLARNTTDLALLSSVIAGHDPKDSSSKVSAPFSRSDFQNKPTKSLSGQKIVVLKEFLAEGLDGDVKEAFARAIEVYKSLGAEIVEMSMPEIRLAIPSYYIIATAEASSNLARYDGVRFGNRTQRSGVNLREMYTQSRSEGFGREVKQRIMLGTYVLTSGYYEAYYGKANRVREALKRKFADIFASGVSLIAAPTASCTAFELGQQTKDSLSMYLSDIYTIVANLAGVPALSHPIGLDRKGLPIGMQLMAKAFDEENLLRSASAYEQHGEYNDKFHPRF
jgi:aspartyl-tRNA(Asn)/glutamyl-tRNA(Gln) amidotransferase subunit A